MLPLGRGIWIPTAALSSRGHYLHHSGTQRKRKRRRQCRFFSEKCYGTDSRQQSQLSPNLSWLWNSLVSRLWLSPEMWFCHSPQKWPSPQPGFRVLVSAALCPSRSSYPRSPSHRASVTLSAATSLHWFLTGETNAAHLCPAVLGSPQSPLYVLDSGPFSDTHCKYLVSSGHLPLVFLAVSFQRSKILIWTKSNSSFIKIFFHSLLSYMRNLCPDQR